MRIALATDVYLPQSSGIADSLASLVAELKKRGHRVRLYAPQVTNAAIDHDIARFRSYAIPGSKESLMVVLPFGLLADLKRFKPDIIHTHTFGTIGLAALYAQRRLQLPFVGTDHTFPAHYLSYLKLNLAPFAFVLRKFAAWYYDQADYVMAPSASMIRELRDYGMTAPAKVISNQILVDLFRKHDREKMKQKYHISGPAVLIFGRVSIEKNLDFALDIFKDVRQRLSATLLVVGDGPYKTALEARVKKENMVSSVKFFGLQRGQPLVEIINAADVYLITSLSDTQSLTTLQALACELPAVGAAAGGLPEYIHHNQTGFIVPPTDRRAFAEKVLFLLTHAQTRQQFGKAGRASVLPFSPAAITEQVEQVYTKVRYDYQSRHSRL